MFCLLLHSLGAVSHLNLLQESISNFKVDKKVVSMHDIASHLRARLLILRNLLSSCGEIFFMMNQRGNLGGTRRADYRGRLHILYLNRSINSYHVLLAMRSRNCNQRSQNLEYI